MDLSKFFALRSGPVSLPDGEPAELEVIDLGVLRVPSGRLAICDVVWLEIPLIVPVPPGDYTVKFTRARVDENYDYAGRRYAYLSLVISDAPTVTVEGAVVEPGSIDRASGSNGGISGRPGVVCVPTTMYNIAFTDAEAIFPGMPPSPETWYDSVIDADGGWFRQMDLEGRTRGAVNVELPRATAGENIVVMLGRRGDHPFPVLATRDAIGELTGIHVDLLVIGELSEWLQAFDRIDPWAAEKVAEDLAAEARAQGFVERRERPRGFWARLFGAS